ncbi:MAG: c-type cytochrome [Myxococcota bacterium]
MSLRFTRFASALAALLTLSLAGFAGAEGHGEDDPIVGYRQMVMSAIGANMGAIGDIMKNRLSLPGAVANHAEQMADAAALIGPAFKKEVHAGATDAKPEIWANWAEFEAAVAKFEEAARGLAAASAAGDPKAIGPAMKTLGQSCGGCHDDFRKPKEESYKKK